MKKIFYIVIIQILLVFCLFYLTGCEKKEEENVQENITENEPVKEEKEEVTYLEYPEKSEKERQILERYSNNNDYKVIEVSGNKFKGYLIAIYEPERVHVVGTSKMGSEGEYLTEMYENTKFDVGINAGGFADANFNGDGGTPLGITISNNQLMTDSKYVNGNSGVIGFTKDNKLILEKYDISETMDNGIRDCVSFGPYLIKDGQRQKLTGVGALGPSSKSARTIIGQREDGIVLFLVVDGDRTKNEGATLGEVTDIMQEYGAINASNLDGGTSCQMTVRNTLINDPTSLNGEHRSRPVSTAFVLYSDDEDNGDYEVVKDKVK